LRQCRRFQEIFCGKINIVNWVSKSVGVGAGLGSLSDGLRGASGGISWNRSFGLSLTDQIDALSRRTFGLAVTDYFKDNSPLTAQYQLFTSHQATDLLKAPFLGFDSGLDVIAADGFGGTFVCQAKTTRWSADDIQHSWVNLTELRWERDWFRNASFNVRSWVTYLDDYVSRIWHDWEDSWTREFSKLDPSVLEKDDWTLTFQYPEFSRPEVVPLIRGCLPDFGEHFKRVSTLLQDLRHLLVKVEGIKNHFDWLCQLGASLLVSFYRCCSLFLSQRRWFLHHSAHPPHARTSYLPGFGGAGALLQLSS